MNRDEIIKEIKIAKENDYFRDIDFQEGKLEGYDLAVKECWKFIPLVFKDVRCDVPEKYEQIIKQVEESFCRRLKEVFPDGQNN